MVLGFRGGGPPHPVIETIRDNRDDIRVLLYSYYTTITGWGGPPNAHMSEGVIPKRSPKQSHKDLKK